MEKQPAIPIKIKLSRLSDTHNVHAAFFQVYDDFWAIKNASVTGKNVVLLRLPRMTSDEMLKEPEKLFVPRPKTWGVDFNGYTYPVKYTVSRNELHRCVNKSRHRWIFKKGKRIFFVGNTAGFLYATDGHVMTQIELRPSQRVPLRCTGSRKFSTRFPRVNDKKISLSRYGTVLNPLESVVIAVLRDRLKFIDPVDFEKGEAGRPKLTFPLHPV